MSELDGLDPSALLGVKKLIKAGLNDQHNLDAVNLRESYAQAERFASGIPGDRFGQIARKELKHKLRAATRNQQAISIARIYAGVISS